jgi:hypothetical protein
MLNTLLASRNSEPKDREHCCDKNVIVPCSEWVYCDQNDSECIPGKRLKNQIE